MQHLIWLLLLQVTTFLSSSCAQYSSLQVYTIHHKTIHSSSHDDVLAPNHDGYFDYSIHQFVCIDGQSVLRTCVVISSFEPSISMAKTFSVRESESFGLLSQPKFRGSCRLIISGVVQSLKAYTTS